MWEKLRDLMTTPAGRGLVAGALLLLGLLVGGVLRAIIGRAIRKRKDAHAAALAGRIVFYGVVIVSFVAALHAFNLELSTLLATAGVFGIALGFATQTSFSNIISGVFLIFERPFRVGDVIRVGDVSGTVEAIDLLSVKLRTFDNLYVRIPNESLIKTNVTNLTAYDIRRADVLVSVAYGADLAKALEILTRVATEHPLVLKKPDPIVVVERMADSGIEIAVRAWFDRKEWVVGRTQLFAGVKAALDEAGIEIPFPQRTISADDRLIEALTGRKPDPKP